jgi:TP53 regulating kinase-like protein
MMAKARQFGVDTPQLYFIDHANRLLFMERIQGSMVKIELNDSIKTNEDREAMARLVAEAIAKLHDAHIVHGDLTTSNLLLRAHPLPETASSSSPSSLVATVAELNTKHGVVMIDFGLSYTSTLTEDKAVDLYVLERAFLATHPELENLFASILQHYEKVSKFGKDVLRRLDAGSSSLFDITW